MLAQYKLLLKIIAYLLGMYSGWEMIQKIKRRDNIVDSSLKKNDKLIASLMRDESGFERIIQGELTKKSNMYIILITDNYKNKTASKKNEFVSIQALDEYLEENTLLRIRDFLPNS